MKNLTHYSQERFDLTPQDTVIDTSAPHPPTNDRTLPHTWFGPLYVTGPREWSEATDRVTIQEGTLIDKTETDLTRRSS